MNHKIYHIRIKKEFAAELIEYLIKADAVEVFGRKRDTQLTDRQKAALNKELAAIAADPDCLSNWYEVKNRLKKI